jgi:protein-tyrosine phosphatase
MVKENKKLKQYEFTSKAEFYSAFRYRNLVFYGGPVDNLGVSSPWDMVLKLDKYSTIPFPKIVVPEQFPHLDRFMKTFETTIILEFSWPDGGLPDLPKSAWQALVKDLQILCDNTTKDLEIAVCCKGGHGRTGTALAILKNLHLNEKADPVASIRKTYSVESVETIRQIQYVEYITGRTVKEKSSYSKQTASSYTTGTSSYLKGNTKHAFKQIAEDIESHNTNSSSSSDSSGDLGSIAVKTSDSIGKPKKSKYPTHKATDCVGKDCPDKSSDSIIHCGKKSATRDGIKSYEAGIY